jgi:hypothetical protein
MFTIPISSRLKKPRCLAATSGREATRDIIEAIAREGEGVRFHQCPAREFAADHNVAENSDPLSGDDCVYRMQLLAEA